MTAKLLDGNIVAAEILLSLRQRVADLTLRKNRPPKLAAIRANSDSGCAWYAQAQAKHCAENGIDHKIIALSSDAKQAEIFAAIDCANADPTIDAILLLLPLPRGIDYLETVARIDPHKDAEGVHPQNIGKLFTASGANMLDEIVPSPCTAAASVFLVRKICANLSGKTAAVIGRSAIVGKPAALLLLGLNATVTLAHSHSDLTEVCRAADVVIAATGAAGANWNRYAEKFASWQSGNGDRPSAPDLSPLIKAEMLKHDAIVIDVGVNCIPRALDENGEPVKNAKGKPAMIYAGDVDFPAAQEVAAYITAPQGGVGPVTNAMLLRNTVSLAECV